MAVSVVAGSAVGASSSTSITKPTSTGYTATANDLILVLITSSQATAAPTLPTGFTSLATLSTGTGANGQFATLGYKLDSGSETALRLGLVQRNVTEMVERPRPADHEMRVLLPGDITALLTVAEGNRLEALYTLALATGMRQGELLALKWRDVDLEAGSLQVRATLQWQDGHWVFAPPKTKKSRRRIALPGVAVKALVAHRLRQMEEQRTLGDTWQDQGLVFCSTIGTPLDAAHVVRRSFFPLLAKAGLPRIRFHDLRHTAATMILMRRVNPKVVSEVLGHASVGITLDIYSHVLPDMQEDATAAMDAVLGQRVLRSMAGSLLADFESER